MIKHLDLPLARIAERLRDDTPIACEPTSWTMPKTVEIYKTFSSVTGGKIAEDI